MLRDFKHLQDICLCLKKFDGVYFLGVWSDYGLCFWICQSCCFFSCIWPVWNDS